MLYDKRWDKQPKISPAPLSMGDLAAWLETKAPHEQYKSYDAARCLLTQFVRARGYRRPIFTSRSVFEYRRLGFWIAKGQYSPDLYDLVAVQRPWTFGAALERARAALSSRHGDQS